MSAAIQCMIFPGLPRAYGARNDKDWLALFAISLSMRIIAEIFQLEVLCKSLKRVLLA
jgi:hypothetical protein